MAGWTELVTLATLACGPAAAPADSGLRALYDGGRTYTAFVAAARSRRADWLRNTARAMPDAALVTRARATGGDWRFLVVLEDGCSDSVNTIPYVAALVAAMGGGSDLRLVTSTVGRPVLDRYRTYDDRGATPTVVLLNAAGEAVGCWVERPTPLSEWTQSERSKLSQAAFYEQKMAWYDRDRGRSTVEDIVRMLEGARPGAPCLGNVRS